MTDLRKDCPMRHENGNCTVIGGFCTAVNDPICEGLHSAYDSGYRAAALRAQQERENPKPLTLDELRGMVGQPVWVTHRDGSGGRWGIVNSSLFGLCANVCAGKAYWFNDFIGTIAYRRKPEGSDNMTQRDCSDCYYSMWEGKKEPCKSCRATDEGFTNWREAPLTNADRIRAISDEELAENRCIEIKGLYPWPIFVAFDVPEKRFLSRESAVAEELNWLQQPAEEADDE